MLRNPIDAFPLIGSPHGWRDVVAILHDWQELDLILFHVALGTPPLLLRYDNIAPAISCTVNRFLSIVSATVSTAALMR
jgi:hypothetical protein